MIQHFQFTPLYENNELPGWNFSYYFKRVKYTGIYQSDGKIFWNSPAPCAETEELLKSQIHELMLFHVYDN
ncbi:YheE family protein [Bacillus massilinigeriensis]|uniref:YheE family protein n=1 Tax=Bacillus mediterraneensis TaxID=1805474 RepID=UPI0008F84306|nr:YheE family protein [Bacillus mediterraneensis]